MANINFSIIMNRAEIITLIKDYTSPKENPIINEEWAKKCFLRKFNNIPLEVDKLDCGYYDDNNIIFAYSA